MNERLEQLRDALQSLRGRFNELEERERRALVALGTFLAVLGLYLLVWSPLNDYVAASRADRDTQLGLLRHFKATEAEVRANQSSGGAGRLSGQSLLSEVSRTAQTMGITPSRMQPEGSDAVSVWFDGVVFTRLMLWVERLETNQGVSVRQISLERRDRPGEVSARLVLRQ